MAVAKEIRGKVAALIVDENMSIDRASKRYGVSPASASRWSSALRQARKEGAVEAAEALDLREKPRNRGKVGRPKSSTIRAEASSCRQCQIHSLELQALRLQNEALSKLLLKS